MNRIQKMTLKQIKKSKKELSKKINKVWKKKQNAKDEMRKRFINRIKENIELWAKSQGTEKDKLEGLAFSILVIIDGESAHLPPFILAPISKKSKVKGDIGGNLHNSFF